MSLQEFYYANAGLSKHPHVKNLTDANDVELKSNLIWLPLKLPFEIPYEAMLEEAKSLHDFFVPHRSYREENQDWFGLNIHGLSSVHTNHVKTNLPYIWTDICRFCPVTHDFFKNHFEYAIYFRLRFMLVKAGGYILPHVDSTVNKLAAINIALNNPKDCDFVVEGCGTIPFEPGSAMMLSLSRNHIVWNRSSEDRYHIIVHGNRNSRIWDDIIMESYRNV